MKQSLNEVFLSGAAVATGVVLFALPIYYIWKLAASFRRVGFPHWPPVLALGLWCLQWPFFLMAMAGCMGGGCGDPARNLLELLATLAYNLGAAYWLWWRPAPEVPQ